MNKHKLGQYETVSNIFAMLWLHNSKSELTLKFSFQIDQNFFKLIIDYYKKFSKQMKYMLCTTCSTYNSNKYCNRRSREI